MAFKIVLWQLIASIGDHLTGLWDNWRRSRTVHYRDHFKNRLNQLKSENRYRSFIELERHVGRHPYATWNSPTGPKM